MPHEAARLADTAAWLRKARDDLRAAEHACRADPPLGGDALFHCQQAVEKVFKALLGWHDREFRKTHNLEELGEACLTLDGGLRPLVDRAVPLTEYAWVFRYPGEAPEPSADEVQEGVAVAQEAYRAVVARLPREVVT
jgi:HEPN domain-containing protein